MNTPIDEVIHALRELDCRPRGGGGQWSALCPAHDDRNPSLSIGAGDDGRVLVRCHAGCRFGEIVESLGLKPRDLFPQGYIPAKGDRRNGVRRLRTHKPESEPPKLFSSADRAIEAFGWQLGAPDHTWDYRDANGLHAGSVLRWDMPHGKTFRQISRIGEGWALRGMTPPRPLFGLVELLTSTVQDVFLVEGERCADAARSIGLLATTTAGGARGPRKSDFSPLRGRNIVVIPDDDEPGHEYAAVCRTLALRAGALSVRILDLREVWHDMPPRSDIADYVEHSRKAVPA